MAKYHLKQIYLIQFCQKKLCIHVILENPKFSTNVIKYQKNQFYD